MHDASTLLMLLQYVCWYACFHSVGTSHIVFVVPLHLHSSPIVSPQVFQSFLELILLLLLLLPLQSVLVHQLSKQTTQNPFRKNRGRVMRVAFHPSKPFFFVATQNAVRIYNLAKQVRSL